METVTGVNSSIRVVVVIYRSELAASVAVSALIQILNQDEALCRSFSLTLYDNSPLPHACNFSTRFPLEYIHDPSNGGLASAYNVALASAEADAQTWLLLFDQDTTPTLTFLREVAEVAAALDGQPEVGAIVPKLLVNGKVYSPETSFLSQLRRQKIRRNPALSEEVHGLQQAYLNAYNSGSTLRVSALRSIGGFPSEFWLDYLDHAVFGRLFAQGYRVYVMRAQLQHQSSLAEFQTIPIWRLKNLILAQTLFVKQNGDFLDRQLYRIYLLRFARNLFMSRKDSTIWRDAVKQAFFLRTPPLSKPSHH